MNKFIKARFKDRPNRFIAIVEIEESKIMENGIEEKIKKEEIAHVPNTGRSKELLTSNSTVYLLPNDNPKRKTKYTLYFVENRGHLVSMYSSQANEIVFEAIKNGKIKELTGYDEIKKEKTVGKSRIDIYLKKNINKNNKEENNKENNNKKENNKENKSIEDCYIEVKGVTLVEHTTAIFPDAPTQRGKKHLEELIKLKENGHRAIVFFLIQHPLGNNFKPNWKTDPEFSKTLEKAYIKGVEILVYKTMNSLEKIEIMENNLKFELNNEKK
ncbi:MAG: DNA/RNA nuclease SfsA [Methanobrevibacter sp.]|jgi:sugar fermentation stimulation protein A|nr:DNA/RNA nuclease SfsA [Candidatus Methanoflexus mossambicus]